MDYDFGEELERGGERHLRERKNVEGAWEQLLRESWKTRWRDLDKFVQYPRVSAFEE